MLKKLVSILMLYSALAIMLGHNFIGHHHHHFEHYGVLHYHSDGHPHPADTDSETGNDNWGHLFSGIQHCEGGFTFITGNSFTDNLSKKVSSLNDLFVLKIVYKHIRNVLRKNAPSYLAEYYNSQNFLPCGLRAPPPSIVLYLLFV